MHFLLIPYALLAAMFVVQYHARRDAVARAGLVVTAGATLTLLTLAIWLRPVEGDSWRYYMYFLSMKELPFLEAMQFRDPDPFYAALNWTVGRFGDSELLLYGATLLIYVGTTVVTFRRNFSAVESAVLVVCYSAFPFFVAYGSSGLRQGMGLAFLLAGYFGVRGGSRKAWLWLLLAPFWHSAMWLGVGVFVVHQLMCRWVVPQRYRWLMVFAGLVASILLSITGLNQLVGGLLPGMIELDDRYNVYFMDPGQIGYRAGFRADFAVFSLAPLLTAWAVRRKARAFDYSGIGWWLSLYLSLNIIYHLFSFAPFADRFAAFSWFLMPLVVFLQVRATGMKNLMTLFVTGMVAVNVLMLQAYTGNFIRPPVWWTS